MASVGELVDLVLQCLDISVTGGHLALELGNPTLKSRGTRL